MRIAALYDIHGNLPALEAVLEEIDRADAELILVGGDVAYGPFVRETLDRLLALGDRALWIRGNADRELVEFYDHGATRTAQTEELEQALAWEAGQLEAHHRDVLATPPLRRSLDVAGQGAVLFCHGSPRSDDEIITAVTPDERLGRLLADVTEGTVVCGHTHVQFDRRLGHTRILNAGSVGLPYQAPGAYWALLGAGETLRRTPYDIARAVARIRASGHPLAETIASTLHQPPAAGEVSRLFEARARRLEEEQAGAGALSPRP